jgi:hypothetical protein
MRPKTKDVIISFDFVWSSKYKLSSASFNLKTFELDLLMKVNMNEYDSSKNNLTLWWNIQKQH